MNLAEEDVRRYGERARIYPRSRLPYLRCLAVLALQMNAIDETIKYLLEALSLAKEMSLPGEEWQILAALSELYTSQGDENTARDHLLRAREIVQRLAKNIGDTQLHELFIRSKQVQLVLIDVR